MLNTSKRQVNICREPEGGTYQQETLVNENAILCLVAFPDIKVAIQQLFPRKKQ